MTEILMPRRRFLTGLVGLLAAPAVVRAESLMPVKALTPPLLAEDVLYLVQERLIEHWRIAYREALTEMLVVGRGHVFLYGERARYVAEKTMLIGK